MARVILGKRTPIKFLTTAWTAPTFAIAFPPECPHCGQPATRQRTFMTERATSLGRVTAHGVTAGVTRMTVSVPVCRRVWPSLVTRLLVVFAAFWSVVFGFMALFSIREPTPAPFVMFGLAFAGLVLAIRAHTWIRLVTFDPGSVTFAVRRASYARALADRNRALAA